jgi:FkbM family methyltransferase
MENVGQSKSRNEEFREKFNRERLLGQIVCETEPIIFDVGAHHGESVEYIKKLFPLASIYSFEPDPDSFDVLSANAIERVTYFNLALSDMDGTASFYRNKISHTNSLLKVNLQSKDSIAIARSTAEGNSEYLEGLNNEVMVPTARLDTILSQSGIDKIDLLKIDVQGAECQVLAGAPDTLRRTKVVVLEISFFDYYEGQTSFLDVEKILAPAGFQLFSISEISNNPMNGRTDWAEVVYLNRTIAKN